VIFNFNRQALQGVPGIERQNRRSSLTASQLDALNAVEAAAQSVQSPLPTELGDIAFVNNFTVLHSREGFEDSIDTSRHLVRVWLKNTELALTLPQPLAVLNDRIYSAETTKKWNVMPKARLNFTLLERLGP
jgi:hypothetical protein